MSLLLLVVRNDCVLYEYPPEPFYLVDDRNKLITGLLKTFKSISSTFGKKTEEDPQFILTDSYKIHIVNYPNGYKIVLFTGIKEPFQKEKLQLFYSTIWHPFVLLNPMLKNKGGKQIPEIDFFHGDFDVFQTKVEEFVGNLFKVGS
jgi:Sybindin-like family